MNGGRSVVVLDRQRLRGDVLAAALRAYGVEARYGVEGAPAALTVVHADSVALLESLPAGDRPPVLLLGALPATRRPAGTVAALGSAPTFDTLLRAVTDALDGRVPRSAGTSTGADVAASERQAVQRLSTRELAVLKEMARGRRNDEIGAELGISQHTVRTHVQNIFGKLEVTNRHAAVSLARRGDALDSGTSA